jgi:propanol-preferring alcohol dehydrogenase
MKGWEFRGAGLPLSLVTKEDPAPGSDCVTVSVRAAGLCHSDVGFMSGELSWMLAHTPIILGHEVAGVVSAVADGVSGWAIGDRVAVAGLGLDAPGLTSDGGFGTTVVAKVEQLIRLPDDVSYAQAAAATDAGQTSRHALRRGEVAEGSRVGIIGLGGLGLTAARIAVLLGAEVHAAEVNREVWPLADQRGVASCADDARELAARNLDVILDFAGFGATTAAAIGAVRDGGRVVQVGLGVTEAALPVGQLVSKQVSLVGSLGGTKRDAEDVVRLLSDQDFEILVTEVGFDDIPATLERLSRGGVIGRQVATYQGDNG